MTERKSLRFLPHHWGTIQAISNLKKEIEIVTSPME